MLSDAEKAIGDFIFEDLNNQERFDLANRVMISVSGEGMDKLENYVTIFRVERNQYLGRRVPAVCHQVDFHIAG
jgi:hypothetical protein